MSNVFLKKYENAYLTAKAAHEAWIAAGRPQDGPVRKEESEAYKKVSEVRQQLITVLGEAQTAGVALSMISKHKALE